MKVANFPKLIFDPAGFDFLLEARQRGGGRIIFLQRFESGFRRQHPALDCQMNSFESLRVEETGRVAENHPTVARDRRNGPPAAVRQRLRAVANHLAAFEQLRDEGMLLEVLQNVLRIKPRIGIIEAGHEAERNNVVLASVDPGAAILFRRQRPAHRIDHFARRDASRRNFPQLFNALAISLRIAALSQDRTSRSVAWSAIRACLPRGSRLSRADRIPARNSISAGPLCPRLCRLCEPQ